MFDDLKQQNNQVGSGPANQAMPQPSSSAPMPSPQGQPLADMFADVDPVAQANQNTLGRPSAVQSGKIKPVSNTAYTPSQQPAPLDPLMFSEASGGKLNKIIIILVVVLLVLALGAGAYYMIAVKGKIKTPINENINTNQIINTNSNENTNEFDMTDSDSDGLTDEEETQYNTNALLADTDGDTLSDREEVKTYQTDPLTMDSDGDGLNDGEEVNIWNSNPVLVDSDNDSYPDGIEIQNGYNPNGPGKLATTTPGMVIDNPVNAVSAAAKAWGDNLLAAIIACQNASNNASLTNYLVGADMCSPKINQNWLVAPDSYPKVCVLDKVIQDNTWTIALQSNSPDTLPSIICNQNGCQEAAVADYPGGKVCP